MSLSNKIERIKKDILGKKYSLSVGLVDENTSQKLNKTYRKKNKPTNVLSFSLRENMGELVLCKNVIRKEAKLLDKKFDDWFIFLVIHGMLHLKGMEHGSIMETQEDKYAENYIRGYRRGLQDDESRSGRISKRRKKS
ncbi:MAG: rRNA maturation RNase YbeY [Candidatus Pacebacteria bacterium]|nr:rRNA maturation RNase YbeY [Candidatus Paceibacterota bacterium]